MKLTNTISLVECTRKADKGFWLYDETRGMNLSMRAETERAAFVEALTYYQKRLLQVEKELNDVREKVDAFIDLFCKCQDHDY